MQKVLISNIGNRNITLNGKYIQEIIDHKETPIPYLEWLSESGEEKGYRSFTKWLLEDNKYEHQDLKITILDKLLNEETDISDIYLFLTDMEGISRSDQDTVFTGEIIKSILSKDYSWIKIHLNVLKVDFTETDAVIKYYRRKINEIKSEHPEHFYIINDAGGTYQLKLSLKIVCEFLLDKNRFKVYYVSRSDKNKSKLQSIPNYEYKKIINTEQAIGLIKSCNYAAASELLEDIGSKNSKHVKFAMFRWEDIRNHADKTAAEILSESQNQLIRDYVDKINYASHTGFKKLVDKDEFFYLSEILSRLQKFIGLGNYSNAILTAYQFIERYLQSVIEINHNIKLLSGYSKKERDKFEKIFNEQNFGPISYIKCTDNIQKEKHNKLNESFKKTFAFFPESKPIDKNDSLDKLRNFFAHKGVGLNKKRFDNLPYRDEFDKWFDILDLPEKNVFDKMNSMLIERILEE